MLLRTEAWALLPTAREAAPAQLQWHQAHQKDATPGQCKQGTSWHVKKNSCPVSQSYGTWWSNALLKPKILLWMSEAKAHGDKLSCDCWGTWDMLTQVTDPKLGPLVVQQVNTGIWLTQFSIWVPALAAAPWVTGWCCTQEFGSMCICAQHCSLRRPALPQTSGWS